MHISEGKLPKVMSLAGPGNIWAGTSPKNCCYFLKLPLISNGLSATRISHDRSSSLVAFITLLSLQLTSFPFLPCSFQSQILWELLIIIISSSWTGPKFVMVFLSWYSFTLLISWAGSYHHIPTTYHYQQSFLKCYAEMWKYLKVIASIRSRVVGLHWSSN